MVLEGWGITCVGDDEVVAVDDRKQCASSCVGAGVPPCSMMRVAVRADNQREVFSAGKGGKSVDRQLWDWRCYIHVYGCY